MSSLVDALVGILNFLGIFELEFHELVNLPLVKETYLFFIGFKLILEMEDF